MFPMLLTLESEQHSECIDPCSQVFYLRSAKNNNTYPGGVTLLVHGYMHRLPHRKHWPYQWNYNLKCGLD